MHSDTYHTVWKMAEALHLTTEQTQKFFEYLENIDNLVFSVGGQLRSRQVIALALVTFCKQEGYEC
jgi:hypothetical protein